MIKDMETFTARLASFDRVLQPERRRSNAKSTKPISWPDSKPSPAELAHAGFFYNPYETNPDNTTCFQCERSLDGWEEEDSPITEHLKHAPDCGWAVMMDIQQHSSNPAEIEDPTSDRIVQARLATFGEQWPHDGKRGWVCQSEKMVEGGWYFCPNEESEDLASCPYCKLSLDGWEPKDEPYDEHYRRSSDCSFFVFAQPPGKKTKRSRSKKGRTSKASSSRLSTQSVATTTSETPSMDVDDTMDESIMSQSTTKAKTTKKSSKSKSKTAKSKKNESVETASEMDVDGTEYAQPEPSKPKRTTRGKKRSSEEMEMQEPDLVDTASVEQTEPPTKKRATKSRNSVAQRNSVEPNDRAPSVVQIEDELVPQEVEPKKGRRTTKKNVSRGRKASETSKDASDSHVPANAELDAEIEAGLAQDVSQVEEQHEAPPRKSSKKAKSTKKTKTAPEETARHDDVKQAPDHEEPADEDPEPEPKQMKPVDTELPPKKTKSTKSTGKRKAKKENKEPEPIVQEVPEPRISPEANDTAQVKRTSSVEQRESFESFVSVEIKTRDLNEESERETAGKGTKKKMPRKKASTDDVKKPKKVDRMPAVLPQSADDVFEYKRTGSSTKERDTLEAEDDQPEVDAREEPEEPEETVDRRRSSGAPAKTTERYSDISQENQFARSFAGSRDSNAPGTPGPSKIDSNLDGAVSPLPSPSKSTPSLSPQSSDAENHPPSAKPSAPRSRVLSPSKQQAARTPLATSTPSPSKRNVNAGGLKSSHPWIPVDIHEMLVARNSDKENVGFGGGLNAKGELSSPEKKMTVEEWIRWNAKNGEERLKRECERLVGQFEEEGGRAMQALEGTECID